MFLEACLGNPVDYIMSARWLIWNRAMSAVIATQEGEKREKTISRNSQRKSITKMRKVLFPEKLFDHETAAKERFQLQLHKEKNLRESDASHHHHEGAILRSSSQTEISSFLVKMPHSHRLRRSVEKSRADDMGILFNLMNWSAGNVVIMPIFLHYVTKVRTHTYELNLRIAWLTLFTSGCIMSILSADVSLERRNLMKFAKNKLALLFIHKCEKIQTNTHEMSVRDEEQ